MKHHLGSWRPVARAVALALILAAVPLPGFAAEEPNKAAPTPGLTASIAKAAASGSVALEQAKPQTSDRAQLGSTRFFRTPAGIATIVAVALGTGFAIYSASHDRIHSVVRQNQ